MVCGVERRLCNDSNIGVGYVLEVMCGGVVLLVFRNWCWIG